MLFLIILIISLILQIFLPWWIIAPISFTAAAWKSKSGWDAFSSAFAAIFLLWIVVSLMHTIPNDNILANRVGQMLGVPESGFNWISVLLITGFTGGMASGFAALAGFHCRKAISN
jgi:hypothetical protein